MNAIEAGELSNEFAETFGAPGAIEQMEYYNFICNLLGTPYKNAIKSILVDLGVNIDILLSDFKIALRGLSGRTLPRPNELLELAETERRKIHGRDVTTTAVALGILTDDTNPLSVAFQKQNVGYDDIVEAFRPIASRPS